MPLNARSHAALVDWVGKTTWSSKHPLDRERFYHFVDVFEREHGTTMHEAEIQEAAEKIIGEGMNDVLFEILVDHISEVVNVLEFIEHTGRTAR